MSSLPSNFVKKCLVLMLFYTVFLLSPQQGFSQGNEQSQKIEKSNKTQDITTKAQIPQSETQPQTQPQSLFDDLRSTVKKTVSLQSSELGVLPSDAKSYYWVLSQLEKIPLADQKKRANRFLRERWKQSDYKKASFSAFPIYADQHFHPEKYQGEMVTLRGYLKRIIRIDIDDIDTTKNDTRKNETNKNDGKTKELYEAWMFTEHSQRKPTVIVCTEIPQGMTLGETTVENVSVTGLYFKKYNYRGQDFQEKQRYRFAPMILAARIERQAAAPAPFLTPRTIRILLIALAVLIFAIILGYRFGRKKRVSQLSNVGMPSELPVMDVPEDTSSEEIRPEEPGTIEMPD